ncbi:MAG: exopolysaccharide biosynthesis protein [Rickettsiales bacterium]|jgi:hypothetical protein|nr:exopolysaccharide biosynthesis protein [Rickettsiales bacterium]
MGFLKISDSLGNLTCVDSERVSIGQILENNGDNLYFVLFFMMVLSLIPTPGPTPFISNFFGILGSMISLDIIRQKKKVYMPEFIRKISIKKHTLDVAIGKINPFLIRIERKTKRRFVFLNGEKLLRLLNWFILLLSLDLIIPIPVLTFIPSLAVILMIFGILNDDGLITTVGIAVGLLSLLVTIKVWLWCRILLAKFMAR